MKTHKTKAGTQLPILNLRGKDYLEVKYRIVWFREEHADWSIETEFTNMADKAACAKATIKDASGRIMATSHKIEAASHFPDFAEKAETGAIGRALALLGYGTQFCGEELDEGKRIVDSPINNTGTPNIAPEQPEAGDGIPDDTYRIPFGKYAQRTLEQVGADRLRDYVGYLEAKAQKDGKQIVGPVADFIKRCDEFIGSFENQTLGGIKQ